MKHTFFCILILTNLIFGHHHLKAQNWTAANRFSIQAGAQIFGHSTLFLPDGGQLICGNFQNTITFGATTLNAPSSTLQSGFLVKFDASLQPLWAKGIPHLTYNMQLDASGNILVAGAVSSKLTAKDSLACLSKLDASGNLISYFEAAGSATSWAKVIRTDAQDNVYLAGERFSSGTAVFGTFSFPSTNSRECFLLKLNPALNNVAWATYTGNSANLDNIYDLELDEVNGCIYTSGNYSQNYSPPIIGCGCYNGDFYVEKHDIATGNSIWKKIFSGGSGDLTKQFVRLSDDAQHLTVAACFKKTTQFEPAISLTANTNTDYHLYLAEMNASDGMVQWAQKLSTTGDAYLWQVARESNELWLYGYIRNQTAIGPFTLTPQGYDVFLAKTQADATVQEAEKLQAPGPDFGYGLDVQNGQVAITGNSMSSTLNIGSFSLTGTTSSVFVARKGAVVVAPPVAGFTAGNNAGCGPLEVQFTNTSLENPTGFQWSFPGGTPAVSTDMNPMVVYETPGQYAVTLIVTNAGGSDTLTQSQLITVLPNQPIAGYSTSLSGLSVQFSDQSTGADNWLWDFGDGQASIQQNPSHTYENCGVYQVSLIAGNTCGADTLTQEVSVIHFPNAVFDFQLDGLQLTLQNQSTGGDSWLWNFGDGQTSSLQNPPPHVYADTGIYIVTLTVTNQCGVSIVQEEVEISQMSSAVTDPAMGARVVIRPNPNSGTFTLDWSFGEGNQAQVRLYSAAGALLHQWVLNGPSRVLQATELPDGVYPLQVASGDKSVWKKLVINRGQ